MLTLEEKVNGIQERLDSLETIFGRFVMETGAAILRLERTNNRLEQVVERMEKQAAQDRREWNKRWGELANRLGTIAEDIVAPNLPRIAHEQFGMDDIEDFMVRRNVRNKIDRSKQHEFDVIVVGQDKVIINETKATPRLEYIDEFIQTLAEIDDYFPEYKGRTIIPVFASLYLADNIVKYLTRRNIYAMAMGAETMTLVNFEQIQSASGRSA
ncbi:MAG: hypothetical protein U0350_45760 [Caldilineaceae bacterium]